MKRAKLIIKGVLEPIFVSEEEGLHAREVLENPEIDDNQTIRIGLWSGRKKEMRFVLFEYDGGAAERSIRQMTSEELDDFKKKIQPFCVQVDDKEYGKLVQEFLDDLKNKEDILVSAGTRELIDSLSERNLSGTELLSEARRYVESNFVGKMTPEGELNFFESNRAIRKWGNLQFGVTSPKLFKELVEKLDRYKVIRDIRNHSKRLEKGELKALVETMAVPSFIKE